MVRSSLCSRHNQFSNLSITININTFNSQIRQAVNQDNPQKALTLFRELKQLGLQPNNLTFPFLSKACAKLSSLGHSKIIHTHVIKSPFHFNVFVQTALVDMYMKCHQVELAYKVFVKMPERDVAAWNVMLLGFSQLGFSDRVFWMFREMRFDGILPDSVTVMGVSRAILAVRELELAKGVHSYGVRSGIDSEVSVSNTWISLYAKCGDLAMAESDAVGWILS
ncbi:pentatricopeptide repeat-containing protein At4g19191, mitochondrial-like [Mercurialis annua]|uniref:pentatricopeptide repeat-containing protein At4g19191, mitochondrial-like n=1 Tax=Mercurialis annua TaxID=3986 RepID=UPI0021609742|nr:pentatricopeptide repeat-containing protein At4g19191, mitochondrial-like [Mercurialis annua]